MCVLIAIARKICMVSNAVFGSVPRHLSPYIAARQFTTSRYVTWSSADVTTAVSITIAAALT